MNKNLPKQFMERELSNSYFPCFGNYGSRNHKLCNKPHAAFMYKTHTLKLVENGYKFYDTFQSKKKRKVELGIVLAQTDNAATINASLKESEPTVSNTSESTGSGVPKETDTT